MTAFLLAACLFIGEREVQVERPSPEATKPTLELDPPQVMVGPGEPFKLKAKTNATKVFFDTEGLRSIPDDWEIKDKRTCFYGIAPSANGTHTITCTVFVGEDRLIRKVLVFVGQNPLPGPPGPVPTPSDPLFAELQKAYAADNGKDKADYLMALASVFDTAANAAINETAIQTTGQLFGKIREVSKLALGDHLQSTRTVLKECCKDLEGSDQPLTPELRQSAAKCFRRAASLVRGLK